MAVKPIPDGYHSVTPHLTVPGVAKLIDFLKQAFDAKERSRMAAPDGSIMHAEVVIGNSFVMLGEPMGGIAPMPCNLYLYVNDVDATYQKAVRAGGTSQAEPADQFWGDRAARVKDPSGNLWFIATHKEEVAPEEMNRRAQAMFQKRSGRVRFTRSGGPRPDRCAWPSAPGSTRPPARPAPAAPKPRRTSTGRWRSHQTAA